MSGQTNWLGGVAAGIALVLILVPAARPASAAPLPREACDKIKSDHDALTAAGLPDTIKKGPAWGVANLTPAKLKEVERFIGLEEQLLFRCGYATVRGQLDGEQADETSGDAEKAVAATGPPPLPRRRSPSLPQRKPSARTGSAGPANAKVETTRGVRVIRPQRTPAQAKPKVDDAYRPPKKPGFSTVPPATSR